MKAGAGAAGDRDEQQRGHRPGGPGHRCRERGPCDGRVSGDEPVTGDEANRAADQHHVEKAATEVASRLEQKPHRHHRRHYAVGQQQHAPDLLGGRVTRAKHGGQIEGQGLPSPDRQADERHEHGRGCPERHPAVPQAETHRHRQQEIEQTRSGDPAPRDRLAVLQHLPAHETRCRHVGEGHDDVDQRNPDERQEEHVGAATHMITNHFGDRAGAVADGSHQRRQVVDAADQDAAGENPGQRRHPAERRPSQDWSHDRSGGGDRRKVLAQQ